MEQITLCPMSFNMPGEDRTDKIMWCSERDCAWWNAECGKCSLCVIAESLRKQVRK